MTGPRGTSSSRCPQELTRGEVVFTQYSTVQYTSSSRCRQELTRGEVVFTHSALLYCVLQLPGLAVCLVQEVQTQLRHHRVQQSVKTAVHWRTKCELAIVYLNQFISTKWTTITIFWIFRFLSRLNCTKLAFTGPHWAQFGYFFAAKLEQTKNYLSKVFQLIWWFSFVLIELDFVSSLKLSIDLRWNRETKEIAVEVS